jgi:hypothetical protein
LDASPAPGHQSSLHCIQSLSKVHVSLISRLSVLSWLRYQTLRYSSGKIGMSRSSPRIAIVQTQGLELLKHPRRRHKKYILTALPESPSKKSKTSTKQPPQSLILLATTASEMNSMLTRSAVQTTKVPAVSVSTPTSSIDPRLLHLNSDDLDSAIVDEAQTNSLYSRNGLAGLTTTRRDHPVTLDEDDEDDEPIGSCPVVISGNPSCLLSVVCRPTPLLKTLKHS